MLLITFKKVQIPPPQLLVVMARCCIAPDKPPITEKEAISLVKQAIAIVPYIEAVELLRGCTNLQEMLRSNCTGKKF
ncbi:putative uncharacterized protein [Parachlamydia acanthamoebae UV-7]|uniref:Uncharacterized protein n=2 Tax=Parachlamydia acanthamoebae TaxID=83552 RepID=F8L130_PARAV|nr:hypothetical protein DB43_GL00210 [Parachlamydia acanthamoebae]CCB86949.1 putative uncharacterized protein [Parachlamydia acanthamoebae UV-7]